VNNRAGVEDERRPRKSVPGGIQPKNPATGKIREQVRAIIGGRPIRGIGNEGAAGNTPAVDPGIVPVREDWVRQLIWPLPARLPLALSPLAGAFASRPAIVRTGCPAIDLLPPLVTDVVDEEPGPRGVRIVGDPERVPQAKGEDFPAGPFGRGAARFVTAIGAAPGERVARRDLRRR